jgi:hypothetical protein
LIASNRLNGKKVIMKGSGILQTRPIMEYIYFMTIGLTSR